MLDQIEDSPVESVNLIDPIFQRIRYPSAITLVQVVQRMQGIGGQGAADHKDQSIGLTVFVDCLLEGGVTVVGDCFRMGSGCDRSLGHVDGFEVRVALGRDGLLYLGNVLAARIGNEEADGQLGIRLDFLNVPVGLLEFVHVGDSDSPLSAGALT